MRRTLLLVGAGAVLAGSVVLMAGVSGSAGSGQARWVITDLGALSWGESEAIAVNGSGQVVGSAYVRKSATIANNHAVLWQRGKMTDLGTLGGPESEAVAVNGSGQIVGWADTRKEDTYGHPVRHAFLWQKGKMTDLGALDGTESGAVAVDGRGQVVGWANAGTKENGDPLSHAFLWQSGRMRDLGGLPGGGETSVGGINERGQMVGIARATSGQWHAILWQDGDTIDLRIPPVGLNSSAAAITGSGQIVGTREGVQRHVFVWKAGRRTDLPVYAAPTADYGLLDFSSLAINEHGEVAGTTGSPKRAFLWKDGKVRVLGTLGGRYSISTGISDIGQVIGQSPTKDGRVHAFLWSNGRMVNLSALPGGTSSQSRAINEHHQVVGWATTKNGQRHAVLWTLRSG